MFSFWYAFMFICQKVWKNIIAMFKIVYLQVIGLRIIFSDIPGGPGVKNLHANAGDTGSISGLGKVHLPQGNCLGATTTNLMCHNYWNPQVREPRLCYKEKPLQWEAYEPQLESCLHLPRLEEACAQQQRPSTTKSN